MAGGFNGMEVLQSVERYCPISNCWEYVDPMRSPRSGVGIIAHENYIYALGGFDGLDRLKTGSVVRTYLLLYSTSTTPYCLCLQIVLLLFETLHTLFAKLLG